MGKLRECTLGKMLRDKYNNFLGDKYHPQDVYAQSTNVERTKLSLQLVLAGLYPSSENQMWKSKLLSMPVSTYNTTDEVDIVLNSLRCPQYLKYFFIILKQDTLWWIDYKPDVNPLFSYKEALAKVQCLPEILEKVASYQKEFEYLSDKTGRNISTPRLVRRYYNILKAKVIVTTYEYYNFFSAVKCSIIKDRTKKIVISFLHRKAWA